MIYAVGLCLYLHSLKVMQRLKFHYVLYTLQAGFRYQIGYQVSKKNKSLNLPFPFEVTYIVI